MMKSLPPVSPARRGYDLYVLMFRPTVSHIDWNTAELPVKWMPPKSRCDSSCCVIIAGSPGTKLMTPSGRPASRRSCIVCHDERIAVFDGFQMTVHPISAAAVGRL